MPRAGIRFPFSPKLVVVVRGDGLCHRLIMVYDNPYAGIATGSDVYCALAWDGNTISWYTVTGNAQIQANSRATEYYYLAIG